MSKAPSKTSGQPAEAAAPIELEEDGGNLSLVGEFYIFLKENRKWWLIPMVLLIVLLGLLIVVSSNSALGPMIYSLL